MLRRLSHLRFRQSIFHTLQTRGHIIFVTGRILINVDQNAGRERGLSIWTFYTGWHFPRAGADFSRKWVLRAAVWCSQLPEERSAGGRQISLMLSTRRDKPGRCGCLPAITMLAPPLLNQPISIMIPWERYKYSFPSPVTGGNSH